MNAKVFLDTNILVYSYSSNEIDKRTIAREIMSKQNSYISTQVLQELTNVAIRKLGLSFDEVKKANTESCQNNNLHVNTEQTILKACDIAERYKYSFYDSLIIAAALESKCERLYSEDMQRGQIIDNVLEIVNPFLL